jgi:hypothetical protein
MRTLVLVATNVVFAWFYYQTVILFAYFSAAFAARTSDTLAWQIVYWLVCLIGVNIYSMIVHQWFA